MEPCTESMEMEWCERRLPQLLPTVSQGFGFSLVSAVGVRPVVVLLLLFEEEEVSLFP